MESALKFLLLPSSLLLLALGLGLLFFLRRGTRFLGVALLVLGGLLYLILGSGATANWLMTGLERHYPSPDPAAAGEVDHIVVLVAQGARDECAPLGARIDHAAVFQELEAMRWHRAQPDATVVVTGWDEAPALMAEALMAMGMPADRIMQETGSHGMHDSAVHLHDTLRDERFVLITSAARMARALKAFEAEDLEPMPAPVDFRGRERLEAVSWLPAPAHLAVSDLAMCERLVTKR